MSKRVDLVFALKDLVPHLAHSKSFHLPLEQLQTFNTAELQIDGGTT